LFAGDSAAVAVVVLVESLCHVVSPLVEPLLARLQTAGAELHQFLRRRFHFRGAGAAGLIAFVMAMFTH
jgi:hypothetical protein